MVGVCGLNVEPHAEDPRVGRMRHLDVLGPHRHAGVAEHLVAEVIEAARGRFARRHRRTTSAAAARLEQRLGFRPTPGRHHSHVLQLES